MPAMRFPVARVFRSTASVPQRTAAPFHTYASNWKENMQSTQGQASPGTASNVGNPISSSSLEKDINSSDADYGHTQDTKSLHTPVSNPSEGSVGQQGDDSSAQQTIKQDPDAPASEKRKNVEKMGQKPLDAGNK